MCTGILTLQCNACEEFLRQYLPDEMIMPDIRFVPTSGIPVISESLGQNVFVSTTHHSKVTMNIVFGILPRGSWDCRLRTPPNASKKPRRSRTGLKFNNLPDFLVPTASAESIVGPFVDFGSVDGKQDLNPS